MLLQYWKRFVLLLIPEDVWQRRQVESALSVNNVLWRLVGCTSGWLKHRNPFCDHAVAAPSATAQVLSFELTWSNIVGIDFKWPLTEDARLVLEATSLTKRVFDSVEDVVVYYQAPARDSKRQHVSTLQELAAAKAAQRQRHQPTAPPTTPAFHNGSSSRPDVAASNAAATATAAGDGGSHRNAMRPAAASTPALVSLPTLSAGMATDRLVEAAVAAAASDAPAAVLSQPPAAVLSQQSSADVEGVILTPPGREGPLYESGLPGWAVMLPSYGLWYRPWLRRVTWLLFVLLSVVSMAMGFYDLYKNVPYFKQVMVALFRPAAAIFEWLEGHTQIRLSILLTYMLGKSQLLVQLHKLLAHTSLKALYAPATGQVARSAAPVVVKSSRGTWSLVKWLWSPLEALDMVRVSTLRVAKALQAVVRFFVALGSTVNQHRLSLMLQLRQQLRGGLRAAADSPAGRVASAVAVKLGQEERVQQLQRRLHRRDSSLISAGSEYLADSAVGGGEASTSMTGSLGPAFSLGMTGIPEAEVAHAVAFHNPRRASFGGFYGAVAGEVPSPFTAASSAPALARAGVAPQRLHDEDGEDDDEVTSSLSHGLLAAEAAAAGSSSQLLSFDSQLYASSAGLRHRITPGHPHHHSSSNVSGSWDAPLAGGHAGNAGWPAAVTSSLDDPGSAKGRSQRRDRVVVLAGDSDWSSSAGLLMTSECGGSKGQGRRKQM
eukprot:gene9853-10012_t